MKNEATNAFPGQSRLLSRLATAIRTGERINLLLGSGLTAPDLERSEQGVPGVAEIIKRVESVFANTPEYDDYANELKNSALDAERYQKAMKFLLESRGQMALNKIIRDAVLDARTTPTISTIKDSGFEKLEEEKGGWFLRPGIKALGELIHEFPKIFVGPTLTSNFDPLAEIAIRKAGGQAQAVFLAGDGLFDNVVGGDAHRVIHFHGYWHGSDTLHTPSQLSRIRPKLEGCLREHLAKGILVVIGYGGWNDVFSQTLLKIISEGRLISDIVWCFYGADEEQIRSNRHFFDQVEPVLEQKLIVYKGIDCHSFLPSLLSRARQERDESIQQTSQMNLSAQAASVVVSIPEIAEHAQAVACPTNDVFDEEGFQGDSPPSVSTWVGRDSEILQLEQTNARVVAITGMGGKGKSTLAAKYVKEVVRRGLFTHWDWRDLHEEGNTVQDKLLSIIYRVTRGQVRPSHLSESTPEYVAKKLLKSIGDEKWLLVLDNVDHYVDVEESVATSTLNVLITLMLENNLAPNIRLVITCRPTVEYSDDNFLEVPMHGFSLPETEKLFELRRVVIDRQVKEDIQSVHAATEGHPLWINLIATQVGKNKAQLKSLLDKIQRSKGAALPLPMLRSIWETLNDKQRFILRCMAELTNPVPEEQLSNYISSKLNFNQFSRAMRAIRSLNLVVIKSFETQGSSTEKIELHPLIREFIKNEYSVDDRRSFISPIVQYFTDAVSRVKMKRSKQISIEISINNIDHWLAKAEIEANLGMVDQATETIEEVRDSLIFHGFREKYIRIADKIISQLDWSSYSITEGLSYRLLVATTRSLASLGRFLETDSLLERIQRSLSGKGLTYALYANERCHVYWLRHEYDHAIFWGEEGLKHVSASDRGYRKALAHTLALAKRDAGHIGEALTVFLDGNTLPSVLAGELTEKSEPGVIYGNVGRCLFLQNEVDDALFCYVKSAELLGVASLSNSHNCGYASVWIGEALEKKGDYLNAFLFYRLAHHQFLRFLPPLAEESLEKSDNLVSKSPILANLGAVEEWRISQSCKQWTASFLEARGRQGAQASLRSGNSD